jgi:TRAP-type C4-dicarboxylate transport system permease small subunit
MWLTKVADAINKIIVPFSKGLVFIGGLFLAAMMFLTIVDVVMRYFLDMPVKGAFDLTEYFMVIVFSFGLPYCTINKDHIKVDILMERLPESAQTIITILAIPISLGIFSLIAWQYILYTQIQFDSHLVSSVLEIPRYPFIALMFLGYAIFVIAVLADALNLIAKAVKR